jgi:hypothetical protein
MTVRGSISGRDAAFGRVGGAEARELGGGAPIGGSGGGEPEG